MNDSIESIAAGLLIWTLRSLAIGLAVLALLGSLRRASASVRHLIIVAGMALIFTMLIVDLAVHLTRSNKEISWTLPAALPNSISTIGADSADASAAMPVNAAAKMQHRLDWGALTRFGLSASLILAVAGFLFLGLRIVIAQFRLFRLTGICSQAEGRIRDLADSIQGAPNCRIHLGPLGKSLPPMTWGTFPACIILPNDAQAWTDETILDVLRHELAHVRRRDALTLGFGQWLQAMQWWNPIAWLMVRKLQIECEHACDDLVVESSTGNDRSRYAHLVLSLASSSRPGPSHLGMANVGNLETRLTRIASDTTNRKNVRRWIHGAVLSSVLLMPIGLAVANAQTPNTEERVFKGMRFDTVVLDAGHGGKDPGARSGDVTEAELNLLLTKKVEQLLKDEGFNVIMTREEDVFVPLATRSALARKLGVKKQKEAISLTLHVGSSGDKADRGFNVFHPEREELNQSMLAELIKDELSQLEDIPFQELRSAKFLLLRSSSIPTVHLDAGILSNPLDRAAITDPAFRLKVAQRIVAAIKRLRGKEGRDLVADAPRVAVVDGLKVPVQIADGFDYPFENPDAEGYQLSEGFEANGHLGDDWTGLDGDETPLGDPIYAIGDGLVVHSQNEKRGWGNIIIVRHAYAEGGEVRYIDSFYGHLQKREVSVGDLVRRGDKIGTMGNNEGMYTTHLHLEIRKRLDVKIRRDLYPRDETTYFSPSRFITDHRPGYTSDK